MSATHESDYLREDPQPDKEEVVILREEPQRDKEEVVIVIILCNGEMKTVVFNIFKICCRLYVDFLYIVDIITVVCNIFKICCHHYVDFLYIVAIITVVFNIF